jgi:hypothetical protein
MNNHLSEDQFARYVIGRSTGAELLHVMDCAHCTAELDRFGKTVTSFRTAVRGRIDERMASQTWVMPRFSARFAISVIPKWRWALVAAVILVVLLVPFKTDDKKPLEAIPQTSSATEANALMDAVSLHLSRTMPAPMEPILALMPEDESTTQKGGLQ